jgi:hypothetical protein
MILMSEKMTKCKKCVTPQLRPLGIPFWNKLSEYNNFGMSILKKTTNFERGNIKFLLVTPNNIPKMAAQKNSGCPKLSGLL